jgi:hypothetical protein
MPPPAGAYALISTPSTGAGAQARHSPQPVDPRCALERTRWDLQGAGAALPFGKGYRFPLRLAPWRNVLRDLQPDLIEVGDPYLTAWAALDARRQLDVPVIGFYHSDLPLLVSNRMGPWFTPNVEAYVSKLYGNFDRVLAPSQVMADKLIGLGVRMSSSSRWALICKPLPRMCATLACAPNWASAKTPTC